MNARKTLRIQRRGMPMNMMTTTIFALRSTTRSSRAATLTLIASSLLLTACTTNQKATDAQAALLSPAINIVGWLAAARGMSAACASVAFWLVVQAVRSRDEAINVKVTALDERVLLLKAKIVVVIIFIGIPRR